MTVTVAALTWPTTSRASGGKSSRTISCLGKRASMNSLFVRHKRSARGRCFRAVDFMSDGHPKLIPIDKETNHQVMHAFRLRKADRPADQPLDPRPQIDVLAFDLLVVCLPHRVLLCLHI